MVNSFAYSIKLTHIGVRYASKKGSGYTRNQGKRRTGKRLGAKKVEGEYVKPGHVIMRQRGTKYYSGKNVSWTRILELCAGHS